MEDIKQKQLGNKRHKQKPWGRNRGEKVILRSEMLEITDSEKDAGVHTIDSKTCD